MAAVSTGKLLKHRVYADDYVAYLRNVAASRAFQGLNLEALDSCGASLGQSEEAIEQTRREWEAKAREAELENLERTLRRQREGLDLLIDRGARLVETTTEACPESELARMAESGYQGPIEAKYQVYLLQI